MVDFAPDSLVRLAFTDELTKLYNRRYLNKNLPDFARIAQESGRVFSLAICDLDKFKDINDTYGHQIGDAALVHLAEVLQGILGTSIIPVRYAGDEFVLLQMTKDAQESYTTVLSVVKALEEKKFIIEGRQIPIQLSIGVSILPQDSTNPDELFQFADQALYYSKRTGRNRVTIYSEVRDKISALEHHTLRLPCPKVINQEEVFWAFRALFDRNGPDCGKPLMIVGDQGTGKTRILNEFQQLMISRGCGALVLRCNPFLSEVSLQVWNKALGEMFKAKPELEALVDPELLRTLSILVPEIQSVKFEGGVSVDSFLEITKKNAEMLRDVVRQIADKRPTILAVDQLAWIDTDSLRLLVELGFQKRPANLFVAITVTKVAEWTNATTGAFMDQTFPAMLKRDEVKSCELHNLDEDQCTLMLNAIMGEVQREEQIDTFFFERTHGNPFFFDELMKWSQEKDMLFFDGEWKLKPEWLQTAPRSAQDLVKMRAEALPAEIRELLSKAAVYGQDFNTPVVKKLTHKDEGEVQDGLDRANEADLIRPRGAEDGVQSYEFSSPEYAEVLEQQITEEDQKIIHQLAAELGEELFPDQTLARLGVMAQHLQAAGAATSVAELAKSLATTRSDIFLPESTQKELGDRISDKDYGEERALTPDELIPVLRSLRSFKVAIQNIKLYPIESTSVKGSVNACWQELNTVLGISSTITVSDAGKTLLINGQQPNQKDTDRFVGNVINQLMHARSFKGISFKRGLRIEELQAFLQLIAFGMAENAKGTDWDQALTEKNLSHIVLDHRHFVAVGERDLDAEGGQSLRIGGSPGAGPTAGDLSELRNMLAMMRTDPGSMSQTDSAQLTRLVQLLEQLVESGVDLNALAAGGGVAAPATAPERPAGDSIRDAIVELDTQFVEKLKQDPMILIQGLLMDDRIQKSRAARMLQGQKSEAIKALIFTISNDPDLLRRRAAMVFIAKFFEDRLPRLVGDFENAPQDEMRVNMLTALEGLNHPVVYQIIRRALVARSPRLRREALGLVERHPDPAIATALGDLSRTKLTEEHCEAVAAMGFLRDTSLAGNLMGQIPRTKPFVREKESRLQVEICRALGRMGDSSAVTFLLDIAGRPPFWTFRPPKDLDTRCSAVLALGEILTLDQLKLLERFSKDAEHRIQQAAARAMTRINERMRERKSN